MIEADEEGFREKLSRSPVLLRRSGSLLLASRK
jgi:hypothetical protein